MGTYERTLKPAKFCGYLFLMLALYPLGLLVIAFITPSYLVFGLNSVYFLFGLSMSGINIAWALSSIYYASPLQVANYQAVHITLTGVRGLVSPFIGFLLMNFFSVYAVFIVSAAMFIAAGILMFVYVNKKKT
jgi:hypothetical protein